MDSEINKMCQQKITTVMLRRLGVCDVIEERIREPSASWYSQIADLVQTQRRYTVTRRQTETGKVRAVDIAPATRTVARRFECL